MIRDNADNNAHRNNCQCHRGGGEGRKEEAAEMLFSLICQSVRSRRRNGKFGRLSGVLAIAKQMSQSSRLRICRVRKSKKIEEQEEEDENHARTTGGFNEKMYTLLNCQSYQWMQSVISLHYRSAPKLRLK